MLIAQLSDIHARAGGSGLVALTRAVDWLQGLAPDAVVLTGDLVDEGWSDGYAAIVRSLDRLGCPWLVLPGNADQPELMRATLPGMPPSGPLHFDRRIAGVRLIGLDVTIAGAAFGDVRPHLDWLAERLGEGGETTLLFTHQHLFPSGIAPMDATMCAGADMLEALLLAAASKPALVASGHVHRAMARLFAGVPAYICPSLCPANPLLLDPARGPPVTDPPALLIHDVRNGGVTTSHVGLAGSDD